MRNFTLGKNGIPLFFFALFLLSGTYSSFGQCPTVDAADSIQYFCDSEEAEISSLTVTNANGTDVVWYTSQTATTPIPETNFLVNGTTYFAGTADGTCAGSRAAVTARIASEPEILGIRASTTTTTSAQRRQSLAVIGVCVADVNNPGLTINDLRTNAEDESNVRWYYSRTATEPIPAGTELRNNTDYFAALVSEEGDCETNRRKTTVRFFSEPAPTGPGTQDFCAVNDPTLGDIEATGNNRYFSTNASQTELSPNTPLVNGRTYFVSTVGENCESTERLAVTVNVAESVELENTSPGIVCELDVAETFPSVDAIQDYYLSLLGEGVPTDGTFNPTPAEMAAAYQNDADGLGNFTTTYTVGCDQVDLTISIIPSEEANAGGDVVRTYDVTQGPVNLYELLTAGAQPVGTFEGYPDGMFDPSTEGPGTYTFNYIVDETSGCIVGSDMAEFNITVAPCEDNAGENVDRTFCRSDAEALAIQIVQAPANAETLLAEFLGDRDTDGTFSGDPEAQLLAAYQAGVYPFTITTTYTVGEGACEDSAEISFTVVEDVDAGGDGEVELSPEDAPVNLFTYLTGTPDEGGTWSSGNGMFDPATNAAGTYTYTVGTEGCMDSADVVVTVTTEPTNPTTPNAAVICIADVQTFFPSVDEIRKYYLRLLPAGVPTNGTLNPTASQLADEYQADEDGLGAFTTVYTVNGESYELTAYVVTEAEAGDSNTVTLTTESEPVNLFDYLGEDALPGGTWSSGNGMFDPATDEPGAFTYTVGYEGCMDSATITVTVNDPTDPTDPTDPSVTPGFGVVCLADVQTLFPSVDAIRNYYLRLLPSGVQTNGTFNPTASQLAEMYQADEDGLGTFTTVYSVNGESYELTVNIVTQAEAGESNTVTLTTEDEPVNLFDYLGEDALPGGTWSSGNGMFDPATDEAGAFTYTVGYEGCMDSATINVIVNDPTDPTDPTDPCDLIAGDNRYGVVCLSDVSTTFPSVDEIRKYYVALVGQGVPTNGTLNPTAAQLATMYQADADGMGEFSTTYTVTVGECTDSVEITVLITDQANAGEDASIEVDADGEPVDLFAELGPDAQRGGTWSSGNGTFDPATDEAGAFTYTVGSGDCMDMATVTVTVTTDPTDPCEGVVDAGTDSSATLCETDVQATFPSVDEIRKYFLSLLDEGVARTGTLNPTASQLATMYQDDEDGLGEFTTTYTLINGECSDSVELTVNIVPVEEANAGTIADFEVCASSDSLDLFGYLSDDASQGGTFFDAEGNEINNGALDVSSEGEYTITYTVSEDDADSCVTGTDSVEFTVTVGANTANAGADNSTTACNSTVKGLTTGGVRNLYLGLLEAGVDRNGTFNPTIQQLIDQYNLQSNIGDFTTVYTVTNGSCTDSAELTVTVLESLDAGQDATVTLEEDATEVVDLFDELGGTPDAGGVWTFDGEEVDGDFDPATDAEGRYTYTVTSDNGCTDTAVVTVQVGEPVACPEVTEPAQTLCTGATVADLLPADATWYDAADATTPLADDTVLTDGGEYFAGDAEGICDTREMVTVTLSDAPDAPTVVTPFEECVVTGATVADLDITAEDGATITVYSDETLQTEVADTDVLTDGMYYVTQTNATGCESDAAVITVTLSDSAAPTLGEEGSLFCEFDNATVADLEERIDAEGDITWYTTATGTETFTASDVLVDGRTYYAASTDDACESSQRLAVTITFEVCEIMIPEAFSPNGDDINDQFVVDNLASEYPNFTMEIYNRWGEPVYKGGASTPAWDGTSTEGSFGSGVLPAGVYFYILYFNDGQTAPTQGRVYLSR